MPPYRFTARSMPPAPEQGQIDYWDETLPGFGMRVSFGGTRTWVVMYRYNGIKRRMKIGNHPAKSLADARDDAREALRKAEKGLDPSTERRGQLAQAETMKELADLYIEQHAKKKKLSWLKDQQILNREVLPLLERKRVIDVTRTDVRAVLQPIIDRDAPIRANHTLEVIRKMFNWAIQERDMAILNPAAGIKKPGETNSRTRYLTPDELKKFWKASHSDNIGDHGDAAFQFLLLTAQREMEVLKMRWCDINWDENLWTIPKDHSKNQLENVIPLTERAMTMLFILKPLSSDLNAKYVFQSDVTGKHYVRNFLEKRIIRIRELTGIKDITIHDLRRTAVTYFGKVKVPQNIKKLIINHQKRKKSDVTEIYDRFSYMDEKREALEKWEEYLLEMVEPQFHQANADQSDASSNAHQEAT